MEKSLMAIVAILGIVLLGATGCATKASVQQEPVAVQEQLEPEPVEISSLESTDAEEQDPCTTLKAAVARAAKLSKESFAEATECEETIHFEFNSDALSAEAKETLDNFAAPLIEKHKTVFVEFQGHTDDFGTDEYNFQLGLARARAVMGYLYSQHGISLQSMNGFSCGESKPIADNSMPVGRALNRRVILVVIE